VTDISNPRRTVSGGGLALAAIAIVLSACLGQVDASATVTASSLIKTTDAAIVKEHSAHVVFVAHSGSPSKTERIVADVGRSNGMEVVTESKADVTLKLTPSYVYVSGNFSGLTTLFGMTSADARKLGRNWEAWKSGTSQYANLQADLTIASVSGLIPKAKGTKLSTEVVNGTTYDLLRWTIAATGSTPMLSNSLTVSVGTTLPVKVTTTASGGTRVTTTVSKWGEPIVVVAPPPASTVASSNISG
jgi:hypothetical protein